MSFHFRFVSIFVRALRCYRVAALVCMLFTCARGAPAILRQPLGGAAGLGCDLTLAVEASGTSALRYQWYRDGARLAGQNNAALWLRNINVTDAGGYHVVVSDATGDTRSDPAVVATEAPSAQLWAEALTPARRAFHDSAGRVFFLYNQAESYANTLGGRLTARLVRLHEATGEIDESFGWEDRLGAPTTLAVRADNGLYAGVMIGDKEGGTIVKLDVNGVPDSRFVAPRFDRMIRYLTLQPDGKLLVAFDSTVASSILAPDLVATGGKALYRLNTDGSVDASFAPLEVDLFTTFKGPPQLDASGRIYLCGFSAVIQDVETKGLFRLNASGQIDATFPNWSSLPSGAWYNLTSFLAQPDGSVVLAGQFGGIQATGVAGPTLVAVRFTPEGNFDASFEHIELYEAFPNGSQAGYPRAITAAADGGFALVGSGFARFSARGALAAKATLGVEPGFILSRSPTTGRFFVPGGAKNDASAGVLVIEPSGEIVAGFTPGQLGRSPVVNNAVALNDGRVLVGGFIDHSGSERRPGTVLFDRDGRVSSASTPFHDPRRTLYSPVTSLMKWPDGAFLTLTSGLSTPTGAYALELGRFLADGQKDTVWTGVGGLGMEPGPDGTYFVWTGVGVYNAYAVTSSGGAALLQRYTASGQPDASFQADLSEACRLTQTGSSEYEAKIGAMLCVRATTDGGAFVAMVTYAGELRVVKLRTDGSRDPAYNSAVLATVPRSSGNWYSNINVGQFPSRGLVMAFQCYSRAADMVALPDGGVFVTGLFAPEGRPNGIARLAPDGSYRDGFTGSGLGLQRPGLLPVGTRLALDAVGRVYLAGRFDSVNGHAAPGLARFLADGTLDRDWQPGVEVHDDLLERPVLVAHGDWLHVFGDVRNARRPHTAGYLRVLLDPAPPSIAAPPVSITANEGTGVTFTVAVQGTAPFTYQWYRGATPISGADAPVFTIPGVLAADAGNYSVAVRNATGSANSSAATLTVTVPRPQTITFEALADVGFTTAPLALGATSTSGLPVVFHIVSGAASLEGSQLTLLGPGPVTLRATQPGDAATLAATPVERTFHVTPNFAFWQTERFTAEELADVLLTGPHADYDGDSFSNLVEYALGGDPKVATNANAPEVASTATEWTFTYTRPAGRTDVSYLVEISSDLTAWTASAVTHGRVATGETETWVARASHSAGEILFFRLRVER